MFIKLYFKITIWFCKQSKVWILQEVFLFRMNLWSVEHFLTIFSSLLGGGFAVVLLLHPLKSDDKNGQEMFNWSEVHSEKKYYL